MLAKVVRNPILKGVRVRNRKVSQRNSKTGDRRSVDAPPEELLQRGCRSRSDHGQRISDVLTCEDLCAEVVVPTGDLHFASEAFIQGMVLESRDGEAS